MLDQANNTPSPGAHKHVQYYKATLETPSRRSPPELDSSSNLVDASRSSRSHKYDRKSQRALNTPQSTPQPKRWRKYKNLDNPSVTFFLGGKLMTGGDSLISLALTLIIILGLTGIWVGTTGWWLVVHGPEYGLARGAGVGIIVVFVSVVHTSSVARQC